MDLSSQTLWCQDVFRVSPEDIPKFVGFTNDYYGGATPRGSRIIFSNGESCSSGNHPNPTSSYINTGKLSSHEFDVNGHWILYGKFTWRYPIHNLPCCTSFRPRPISTDLKNLHPIVMSQYPESGSSGKFSSEKIIMTSWFLFFPSVGEKFIFLPRAGTFTNWRMMNRIRTLISFGIFMWISYEEILPKFNTG